MEPNRQELEDIAAAIAELETRKKYRKLDFVFPETGEYGREFYKKHIEFMNAGAKYKQRALCGGNRTGKSFTAGTETVYHLTGCYPDWWEGKRFNHPITAMAAGVSHPSVRDVIQDVLLGPRYDEGSGLIPKNFLPKEPTSKPGIPMARMDIFVDHFTNGDHDGISTITLKSYDQGAESVMGAKYDWVWLDEEAPWDFYSECLTRTATTKGSLICTFTPLNGLTEMLLSFLPNLVRPVNGEVTKHKYVQVIGWKDLPPHLAESEKEQIKDSYLPHELAARTTGIPSIASGAIYPVPEEDISCDVFPIPNEWPRAYGFDDGWNRTAAVWAAYHKQADTWYIYDEYYMGHMQPSVHADAVKSRGAWIYGAIDPASRARRNFEGTQLLQLYRDLGLNLIEADNAVEAGLLNVFQRLSSGRIKIFKSCQHWFEEYRLYRRDKNGNVVKSKDHLMDAMRYLLQTGIYYATTDPGLDDEIEALDLRRGRDSVTGY